MKRGYLLKGTAGLCVIVLSSGCTVVGKWQLSKTMPSAAVRDVDYLVLRMDEDGSFYADASENGIMRTTSGTYTYRKGVLNFRGQDGVERTYDASMQDNNHLKLVRMWEGRRMELKYDRQLD